MNTPKKTPKDTKQGDFGPTGYTGSDRAPGTPVGDPDTFIDNIPGFNLI